MKKIIFALPIVALFTYCSSSRRVTTPPAGPGISNVSIITGKDTVKGSNVVVNPDTRDWAYRANRDTTLLGTWTLTAMATEDGGWSTTDQWYKDTTALSVSDSATATISNTQEASTQTFHSGSATMKQKTSKGGTKTKTKSTLRPTASLQKYDSLMANRVIYTDSMLKSNIKPYEYWKRIPTVSLNPTSLVFTGNTGCNTMSGSFNFSDNNIKFNKNITTSKMACNEYNETAFLNLLRRADNYSMNAEGQLELRQGNTLLMVFSRQM